MLAGAERTSFASAVAAVIWPRRKSTSIPIDESRIGTYEKVLSSSLTLPFKSPTGALYPLSITAGFGLDPVIACTCGSSGRTVAKGHQWTVDWRRGRPLAVVLSPLESVDVVRPSGFRAGRLGEVGRLASSMIDGRGCAESMLAILLNVEARGGMRLLLYRSERRNRRKGPVAFAPLGPSGAFPWRLDRRAAADPLSRIGVAMALCGGLFELESLLKPDSYRKNVTTVRKSRTQRKAKKRKERLKKSFEGKSAELGVCTFAGQAHVRGPRAKPCCSKVRGSMSRLCHWKMCSLLFAFFLLFGNGTDNDARYGRRAGCGGYAMMPSR